jgi:hypothetical protein
MYNGNRNEIKQFGHSNYIIFLSYDLQKTEQIGSVTVHRQSMSPTTKRSPICIFQLENGILFMIFLLILIKKKTQKLRHNLKIINHR